MMLKKNKNKLEKSEGHEWKATKKKVIDERFKEIEQFGVEELNEMEWQEESTGS